MSNWEYFDQLNERAEGTKKPQKQPQKKSGGSGLVFIIVLVVVAFLVVKFLL